MPCNHLHNGPTLLTTGTRLEVTIQNTKFGWIQNTNMDELDHGSFVVYNFTEYSPYTIAGFPTSFVLKGLTSFQFVRPFNLVAIQSIIWQWYLDHFWPCRTMLYWSTTFLAPFFPPSHRGLCAVPTNETTTCVNMHQNTSSNPLNA